MARISLTLAGAHSLKEKRMVIRRIKDRVRERLGVFVSEVGSQDVKDAWQRSELGVAVASGDRQKALSLIDEVVRVAMAAGGAEIVAIAKDAITFDAPASPLAIIDDRTGSGDKAAGSDDWVPDAWREEPDS
ncbi:MAG TPA: DUF503 domain-containing protein [Kofleriaceae bacterium]|nr:DUF503 domain-containing protein [Kofleriaceae bacterium]